jgi:hypothetical protein
LESENHRIDEHQLRCHSLETAMGVPRIVRQIMHSYPVAVNVDCRRLESGG